VNSLVSEQGQIPLDIGYKDKQSFAQFNPGNNKQVFESLKKIATGSDAGRIYLWGQTGMGKSHLLHAACIAAGENKRSAIYIPLTSYKDLQALLLEGMDNMDLVCIDDIGCIARDSEWEQALLHLYNRIRDAGGSMLITGSVSPQALELKLEDLRSRMGWDLIFHLEPLSDSEKINVLQQRAHLRGFELSDEVAEYLVKRVKRDLPSLIKLLNKFDDATLVEKKKLTVPFVKSLLERD